MRSKIDDILEYLCRHKNKLCLGFCPACGRMKRAKYQLKQTILEEFNKKPPHISFTWEYIVKVIQNLFNGGTNDGKEK